jgi:MFS family permease
VAKIPFYTCKSPSRFQIDRILPDATMENIAWLLEVSPNRYMSPFIFKKSLIGWLLGKKMALSRTYIRLAGLTLCVYTRLYGLTEWLEAAKVLNFSTAGLLILPMSIISAVVAALVSRRNMVRSSLILAAGFSIAASVGVLFLSTGSSIIFVIIITLQFGVTMGTMVIGNQTVLYMLVPANQIGTASGLFRTAGYIGFIASSAIISVVFNKSVSESGLHVIAITMIVASALALLLTVTDRCVMTSPKEGEDGFPLQQETFHRCFVSYCFHLPLLDPASELLFASS